MLTTWKMGSASDRKHKGLSRPEGPIQAIPEKSEGLILSVKSAARQIASPSRKAGEINSVTEWQRILPLASPAGAA
ncbi:hypothetical protein EAO82_08645 [Halopseudomonas pelagia]|uniref:Uncharacterized protein n=1 Tax=Halopseudomonas pelagia TaxID=553151 RepID=A0AA91Z6H3_9GAMM|nr:hypothetical protein CO192_07745 [Halopseudomonas pelagia]QFY56428.1 hypothetical protein EAO82_08645 [Halopseudomonas pelagia]